MRESHAILCRMASPLPTWLRNTRKCRRSSWHGGLRMAQLIHRHNNHPRLYRHHVDERRLV